MKRPKFIRVIAAPEPRAGKDGRFRREGDVLKKGTVVPVEWFEDTPDAVFVHLINPPEAGGLGVIEEYEPDMKLLAVLREQYPGAFNDPTPSPSLDGASDARRSPLQQGGESDKTDSPVLPKTRTIKKQEDGE